MNRSILLCSLAGCAMRNPVAPIPAPPSAIDTSPPSSATVIPTAADRTAATLLPVNGLVVFADGRRLFAADADALELEIIGPAASLLPGLGPEAGQPVQARVERILQLAALREVDAGWVASCRSDSSACALPPQPPPPAPPSAAAASADSSDEVGCVGIFQVRCGPPKRLVGFCRGFANCP